MSFYKKAPAWNKDVSQKECPHGSIKAKPKQFLEITGATVLRIKQKGAFYRDAYFDGTFMLADNETINLANPSNEIEVYCLWFGYRLKTRGIKLQVDLSKAEIIVNYDGEIVKNIAT